MSAQGVAALAQKIANRNKSTSSGKKKSNGKKKSAAKKSSVKKQSAPATGTITPRVDRPWAQIKKMYEAGNTKEEMSKTLKIKLSSMNGIMDRLVRGIEVKGKIISIDRGKKSK